MRESGSAAPPSRHGWSCMAYSQCCPHNGALPRATISPPSPQHCHSRPPQRCSFIQNDAFNTESLPSQPSDLLGSTWPLQRENIALESTPQADQSYCLTTIFQTQHIQRERARMNHPQLEV
jgi:hypothetical protein